MFFKSSDKGSKKYYIGGFSISFVQKLVKFNWTVLLDFAVHSLKNSGRQGILLKNLKNVAFKCYTVCFHCILLFIL